MCQWRNDCGILYSTIKRLYFFLEMQNGIEMVTHFKTDFKYLRKSYHVCWFLHNSWILLYLNVHSDSSLIVSSTIYSSSRPSCKIICVFIIYQSTEWTRFPHPRKRRVPSLHCLSGSCGSSVHCCILFLMQSIWVFVIVVCFTRIR